MNARMIVPSVINDRLIPNPRLFMIVFPSHSVLCDSCDWKGIGKSLRICKWIIEGFATYRKRCEDWRLVSEGGMDWFINIRSTKSGEKQRDAGMKILRSVHAVSFLICEHKKQIPVFGRDFNCEPPDCEDTISYHCFETLDNSFLFIVYLATFFATFVMMNREAYEKEWIRLNFLTLFWKFLWKLQKTQLGYRMYWSRFKRGTPEYKAVTIRSTKTAGKSIITTGLHLILRGCELNSITQLPGLSYNTANETFPPFLESINYKQCSKSVNTG